MQLGRVIGTATATVKHPTFQGERLLVVQLETGDGRPDGEPVLVFDRLGAGRGDQVLCTNDGRHSRSCWGPTRRAAGACWGCPIGESFGNREAHGSCSHGSWGHCVERGRRESGRRQRGHESVSDAGRAGPRPRRSPDPGRQRGGADGARRGLATAGAGRASRKDPDARSSSASCFSVAARRGPAAGYQVVQVARDGRHARWRGTCSSARGSRSGWARRADASQARPRGMGLRDRDGVGDDCRPCGGPCSTILAPGPSSRLSLDSGHRLAGGRNRDAGPCWSRRRRRSRSGSPARCAGSGPRRPSSPPTSRRAVTSLGVEPARGRAGGQVDLLDEAARRRRSGRPGAPQVPQALHGGRLEHEDRRGDRPRDAVSLPPQPAGGTIPDRPADAARRR